MRKKKTMGDRAFIASAPTLWNDLPLEIRMGKSVDIFKKLLRRIFLVRPFILSFTLPIYQIFFSVLLCKIFILS